MKSLATWYSRGHCQYFDIRGLQKKLQTERIVDSGIAVIYNFLFQVTESDLSWNVTAYAHGLSFSSKGDRDDFKCIDSSNHFFEASVRRNRMKNIAHFISNNYWSDIQSC